MVSRKCLEIWYHQLLVEHFEHETQIWPAAQVHGYTLSARSPTAKIWSPVETNADMCSVAPVSSYHASGGGLNACAASRMRAVFGRRSIAVDVQPGSHLMMSVKLWRFRVPPCFTHSWMRFMVWEMRRSVNMIPDC